MLFFYVRHGEPIYVPDGLTDLGKQQAEALVSRMQICKQGIMGKLYFNENNIQEMERFLWAKK